MNVLLFSTKSITSVKTQQKDIKLRKSFWVERQIKPISNQVKLLIQRTSLRVSIDNPIFKHILVALRNISNQEINQYDKKEENEENPWKPKEDDHDVRA